MRVQRTLLVAALAAVAPGAFAESVDVAVTGRILPGTCSIDLGQGGVADLGDIRAQMLDPDEITELDPVDLTLAVACDSKVRFAFEAMDNASDSAVVSNQYGLGLTPSGEKIGGADIRFFDIDVDGAHGYWTRSYNSGVTWSPSDGVFTQPPLMPDQVLGFTPELGVITGPEPIENLHGKIRVVAKIAPLSQLTLNEDVFVNGSATLSIVYL